MFQRSAQKPPLPSENETVGQLYVRVLSIKHAVEGLDGLGVPARRQWLLPYSLHIPKLENKHIGHWYLDKLWNFTYCSLLRMQLEGLSGQKSNCLRLYKERGIFPNWAFAAMVSRAICLDHSCTTQWLAETVTGIQEHSADAGQDKTGSLCMQGERG